MIYEANTVRWKVGDLVLHDADAKKREMLMRVVGYSERTKICFTQYVKDGTGKGKRVWVNDVKYLHDPRRFAISLPDAGLVECARCHSALQVWRDDDGAYRCHRLECDGKDVI